jgi:hypothetical protein
MAKMSLHEKICNIYGENFWNNTNDGYELMCAIAPFAGVRTTANYGCVQVHIAETVREYMDNNSKKVLDQCWKGAYRGIYKPQYTTLIGHSADFCVMAVTAPEYFQGVAKLSNDAVLENSCIDDALVQSKKVADILRKYLINSYTKY